jgi:hypothetical protein
MESVIAIAAVAVLAGANAFATRSVLRDRYSERRQKIFQILAVWLVPVFGVTFIFALHRTPDEPSGTYRETPDPGDDFATSRQVGRSIHSAVDD